MSACRCMIPPFNFLDFDSEPLGIDETHGRFGEVSINTCKACKTKWLRYLVEYEAFSESGRWYRTPVSADVLASLTPEKAVEALTQAPWFFYGGSYFRTAGMRGSGRVLVDM